MTIGRCWANRSDLVRRLKAIEGKAFLRSDECRSDNDALEETAAVIDGLESPPGMELLATVDWMVDDRLLGLAIDRLTTAQIEK
ncbi:MAG UNVERIFIED_CONTAM: hypothetical protein LVR18_40830 [Planctomycetaceae bacterium]|jgi:hypothetical protein